MKVLNTMHDLHYIAIWQVHFLCTQFIHETHVQHLSWITWSLSFRYILFHEQSLQMMLWHLNGRVNSHQKIKANAVSRLLSSLVWIDLYNECNGMTSFMEFMWIVNDSGCSTCWNLWSLHNLKCLFTSLMKISWNRINRNGKVGLFVIRSWPVSFTLGGGRILFWT